MPSKYAPIRHFLSGVDPSQHEITLSFARLEQILGFKLPKSAYQYQAWWANEQDPQTHVQKICWMQAGWEVEAYDLSRQMVRFRRARQVESRLRGKGSENNR